MIEVLAQLTNMTLGLAVGAVVVVGANIAFGMKVLNRLQSDLREDHGPAANSAERAASKGSLTHVATPRPRRLQPVATPGAGTAEIAAVPRAVKLGPISDPEQAKVESVPVVSDLPAAVDPMPMADESKVAKMAPVGALVLASAEAQPADLVAAKDEKASPSLESHVPPFSPPAKEEEVPVTGRRLFDRAISAPIEPKSHDKFPAVSAHEPKEGSLVLPVSLLVPALAVEAKELASAPTGSVADAPAVTAGEVTSSAEVSAEKPAEVVAKTEAAEETLPSGDVTAGIDMPANPAEEADDVKKKTPRIFAPPTGKAGLMVIPPTEPKPELVPIAPAAEEPAIKDEATPIAAITEPEPAPAPAVADLPVIAKSEPEKLVKGPRVFLPGKFFGRGNKEREAAKQESPVVDSTSKSEEPTDKVDQPTLKTEDLVTSADGSKADEVSPQGTSSTALGAESATDAAPKSHDLAAADASLSKPAESTESAHATPSGGESGLVLPPLPVSLPSEAGHANPVDEEAPKMVESSVASSPFSSAFTSQPYTAMSENETTTSLPNSGRASAQLTLGFEITSLQLTPFFKLGAVQLKALSNVVSLHLVAAQADNPLAAGISFQIDRVDLDGSSHIKSILLKPLGESRAATVPLSKLQVDNVAIMSGGEGAPISVTTSDQASTAVQLFGTFTIAAMDFTPAFEIGSLRLEPTSNTVLLRVAPSSRPTALDLPPSFEVASIQLGDGAQISTMRLTPSGAK